MIGKATVVLEFHDGERMEWTGDLMGFATGPDRTFDNGTRVTVQFLQPDYHYTPKAPTQLELPVD